MTRFEARMTLQAMLQDCAREFPQFERQALQLAGHHLGLFAPAYARQLLADVDTSTIAQVLADRMRDLPTNYVRREFEHHLAEQVARAGYQVQP